MQRKQLRKQGGTKMKKAFTLLVAVMMLFSIGWASAEEAKEITFQGIPWESDFSFVTQQMLDAGFISPELPADTLPQFMGNGYGTYLFWDNSIQCVNIGPKDYPSVFSTFHLSGPFLAAEKKIGGYGITRLDLTFAKERDTTKFLTAVLTLQMENAEQGYSDLAEKLTSIYGESHHYDSRIIFDAWLDKNKSSTVFLTNWFGEIILYYGTLNGEAILNECLIHSTQPSNTADGSDTSGL